MANILIIDDDEEIRCMLRTSLEAEGYRITEARDGGHGLSLFLERNGNFDLVITDIIMPNQEGVETARQIRKAGNTKIIAISGGGYIKAETYLEIAKKFGVNRVFTKPFKMDELLQNVKELLGKE